MEALTADVLRKACEQLMAGRPADAEAWLSRRAPFVPPAREVRRHGPLESTRVFVRDGFVDRYSGTRLVYPPALRAISAALPGAFPFHPNWRTDRTHPAYWRLSATVDHVVPVSRGGTDERENLVTTSMLRNSAKLNWTLEELAWRLHPPGSFAEWDGLLGWFVAYAAPDAARRSPAWVRRWHRAARTVLGENSG
jgi:hypothetical protein